MGALAHFRREVRAAFALVHPSEDGNEAVVERSESTGVTGSGGLVVAGALSTEPQSALGTREREGEADAAELETQRVVLDVRGDVAREGGLFGGERGDGIALRGAVQPVEAYLR